jgi:2-(1,2-epoxy-1,2-dihydrophenyl)acetyl-CoA isomerase
MPSPNLNLVRSIYAAWGRGDFSAIEWADSGIEFVIVGGPDPGSWRGLGGIAEGWRGWLGAWDHYGAEADDYRELDPGRVLVLGRMRGRGKTSGVKVETEFANLLDIRDGSVVRLTLYSDRDRALADLGLAPEGE